MSDSLSTPAPTREQLRGLRALLSYQSAHVSELEAENHRLKAAQKRTHGPESNSDPTTRQANISAGDLEQLVTGAVLRALTLSGYGTQFAPELSESAVDERGDREK